MKKILFGLLIMVTLSCCEVDTKDTKIKYCIEYTIGSQIGKDYTDTYNWTSNGVIQYIASDGRHITRTGTFAIIKLK